MTDLQELVYIKLAWQNGNELTSRFREAANGNFRLAGWACQHNSKKAFGHELDSFGNRMHIEKRQLKSY